MGKGLKQFGCMYCKYQTYRPEDLAAHFLKEHKQQTQAFAPPPVPRAPAPVDKTVDMWTCSLCPEAFKTTAELEEHSGLMHTTGLF